jgi:uncharacterized protein YndB with AHSA1/START domain
VNNGEASYFELFFPHPSMGTLTEQGMMLRVMIIIAVLIAMVLIVAASKPKTFRIQRSIGLDAPPERVFTLIDDLHNWARWAPQDGEDSSMMRTYSGSANGKGAVSEWTGSGSSGRGRMFITESLRPTRISIQVDWVKPFVARNMNEFVLEGSGTSTRVIWTMQGPNLYVMRIMGIFVNMDRTMGKHFEAGLANLKAVAEQGASDKLIERSP